MTKLFTKIPDSFWDFMLFRKYDQRYQLMKAPIYCLSFMMPLFIFMTIVGIRQVIVYDYILYKGIFTVAFGPIALTVSAMSLHGAIKRYKELKEEQSK